MSDDLVTWLRVQLDDDELTAGAALRHSTEGTPARRDALGGLVIGDRAINPAATDHLGRWHPRRVLAEVEAKRRILALHVPSGKLEYGDPLCACGDLMPCDTVRVLALPYAAVAGYLDEWRP